jgi:outer membrane protein TolC
MGRDKDFSQAQQNMIDRDNDYWLIALQFSMPLDQIESQRHREGHKLLAEAQRQKEQALLEDRKRLWTNTVNTAQWMKSQITILRELEDIQFQKANLERTKLSQGRSTIYQVLMFEQDFVNVRSQRVNLESQIRQFISQLSLFTEEASL